MNSAAITFSLVNMSVDRRSSRRSSELSNKNVAVTSVLDKQHALAVIEENATLDDKTLGALGYKQEFKRFVDTPSDFVWTISLSFGV